MAAINLTTYSGLTAAVADWLNRADLTDQIPGFVALAEAGFNRELRVRDMLVRAHATSDAEMVPLPADFLEHYSLVIEPGGSNSMLRYMSEKETNELKANRVTGSVSGYTLSDNAFELVPAPSGDVLLRLVYYARVPALSATAPSNWLLAKAPDLYLYGALLQAAPYLNDVARLETWATMRSALMEALRMESEAAMRPRAGMLARARSF
jgi:hypothetical protein